MSEKNTKNISKDLGTIDVKSYLLKVISYWKLFTLTLILCLAIAKYRNMMEEDTYKISSLIAIDEKSNPMLTSSTNISFNWGGASNMVESVKADFKSRTHNEKVVSSLQCYINYLEKEKILFETRYKDVYGYTPFKIKVKNTDCYQIQNHKIKLVFIDSNKVQVSLSLPEDSGEIQLYNYNKQVTKPFVLDGGKYLKNFDVDKKITTPFCEFNINLLEKPKPNTDYYISFGSFNKIVSHYRNIDVKTAVTGTSLLDINLKGTNKKRLIDYINKTIYILGETERNKKIKYAVQTKKFIDSLFDVESNVLKDLEGSLISFKSQNALKLSNEGKEAYEQILNYNQQKKELENNTELLLRLKNNALTQDIDIKNIPLGEITDIGLQASLTELINFLLLKEKLLVNDVYPTHPDFIDLESKIKISKQNIKSRIDALVSYNSIKSRNIKEDLNNIKTSIKDL
ncbi:MAG: hypothetical protein ABF273_02185, partial [Wenyingzhuangia sp.]